MEQETETPRTMTLDEYFAFNESSDVKHEFYDGKVISMAGGSRAHALIPMNMVRAIGNRLKGNRCRIYSSDLRVKIPNHPTYVYPDLTIVCGQVEVDPRDKSKQSIVNPTLVMEVISPSTMGRDYRTKTAQYLTVDSLQEVLLVSQDIPQVDRISKSGDGGWRFTPVTGIDSVLMLPSLEIEIPMSEIFDGVDFSSE